MCSEAHSESDSPRVSVVNERHVIAKDVARALSLCDLCCCLLLLAMTGLSSLSSPIAPFTVPPTSTNSVPMRCFHRSRKSLIRHARQMHAMHPPRVDAQEEASRPLSELLQSLPQELYDWIYKLTFSAEPNGEVDIETSNTFPALLHVDRLSRETFAVSYSTTTTFTFKYRFGKGMSFVNRWSRDRSSRQYGLVAFIVAKFDAHVLDQTDQHSYVTKQKDMAEHVFDWAEDFLGDSLLSVLRVQV